MSSWYSFVKIAGPTQKIQRYNISDPYLTSFVFKYENFIPWDNINTSEDIQSYIKQVLLKQLYSKIDPSSDNNNYIKDIDLDSVNKDKKEHFFKWWNYITEENDVYNKNPAFMYLMLKPIIDSSPEESKTPSILLNAQAVAAVWENLANNPQLNIYKSYRKENAKLNEQGLTKVKMSDESGWIRIPSQTNDPENFENNIDKLMSMSCNMGWCVAGRSFAHNYLAGGDFWLLLENGNTKVAIRLEDNEVSEIRGKDNKEPTEYWEEIIQFLEQSDLDYENSNFYRSLKRMAEFNEDIENLMESGQQERAQSIFAQYPHDINKLSKNNRELYPELVEEAAKNSALSLDQEISVKNNGFWTDLLSRVKSPDDVNEKILDEITNGFKGNLYLREIFDEYEKIPDFIKEKFPKSAIRKISVLYYIYFLWNNALSWTNIPQEIKEEIGIDRAALEYDKILDGVFVINFWENIPEDIKQKIGLKNLANKLVASFDEREKMYKSNSLPMWNYVPQDIRDALTDEQKRKLAKKAVEYNKTITYNTIGQTPIYPDDLVPYMTLEERVESWIPFIRFQPEEYVKGTIEIPEDIKEYLTKSGKGNQTVAEGYMRLIVNRPEIYRRIKNENIKNLIDIDFVKQSLQQRLSHSPGEILINTDSRILAEELLTSEEIQNIIKSIIYIKPSIFERMDERFQSFISLEVLVDAWNKEVFKNIKLENVSHFLSGEIPHSVLYNLPEDTLQKLRQYTMEELTKSPHAFDYYNKDFLDIILPEEFLKEFLNKNISANPYYASPKNLTDKMFRYIAPENQEEVLKRLFIYMASPNQDSRGVLNSLSFVSKIPETIIKTFIEKYPKIMVGYLYELINTRVIHGLTNIHNIYSKLPEIFKNQITPELWQIIIDAYKEFLKEEYNRRDEYSRDKIWQEIPEEIKLQMPDMNPQNIQQQNI